MIGRDEKMLVVFEWIRTAAKSDISVLVLGTLFATLGGLLASARLTSARAASRFPNIS